MWEGPGGCGGKQGVGVRVAWDPEAWEAGVHQAKLHVGDGLWGETRFSDPTCRLRVQLFFVRYLEELLTD